MHFIARQTFVQVKLEHKKRHNAIAEAMVMASLKSRFKVNRIFPSGVSHLNLLFFFMYILDIKFVFSFENLKSNQVD